MRGRRNPDALISAVESSEADDVHLDGLDGRRGVAGATSCGGGRGHRVRDGLILLEKRELEVGQARLGDDISDLMSVDGDRDEGGVS